MWDNPRLLNLTAGFLVGIASLLFALVALQLLVRSEQFPLRQVEVVTVLQRTTSDDIEAAVRASLTGNFFALDIARVRASLEALPWVRRAAVRRVWPDRLRIRLEEHVALARWSAGGLINVHGERFYAHTGAALPLFVAPPGTEAEVARRYARFADAVAPLGAAPERVVLTPRLAWQLRLANGLHLMLGRDAQAAEIRLRRFVGIYPAAREHFGSRHDYVDLRYPNGFALRLAERG